MFREAGLPQDLAETDLVRAECALVEGRGRPARERSPGAAERVFVRRRNLQWQRKAQLLVLAVRPPRRSTNGRRAAAARRSGSWRRGPGALAEDCRAERRARPGPVGRPARPRVPAAGGRRARPGADPAPADAGRRPAAGPAAHPGGAGAGRAAPRRPVRAAARGAQGPGRARLAPEPVRLAGPAHRQSPCTACRWPGSGSRSPSATAARPSSSPRSSAAGPSPSGWPASAPPSDERTAELLAALRQTEEEARGLRGRPVGAGETLPGCAPARSALQRDIRARAWELEGGIDGDGPTAAPRAPASPRPGPPRAPPAPRSSPTSSTAAGGPPVLASARRPGAGRPRVRGRGRRARPAGPRRPRRAGDAVPPTPAARRRTALARRRAAAARRPAARPGRRRRPARSSCLPAPALVLLPWSLLPSRRGLPVVVTPSATAWLRAGAPSVVRRPRVVSVAGPGLHRAEERGPRGCAPPVAGRRAAHRRAAPRPRGPAARSPRADLVHVAAHGTHQQESPLFSSLRVADGPLYAYELDAGGPAPRRAWCCRPARPGLATVRPGDEGLGLTSVLLHLGSRSVLAGVARVGDDVAARVMAQVHAVDGRRHRERRRRWRRRSPTSPSRRRSWPSGRPGRPPRPRRRRGPLPALHNYATMGGAPRAAGVRDFGPSRPIPSAINGAARTIGRFTFPRSRIVILQERAVHTPAGRFCGRPPRVHRDTRRRRAPPEPPDRARGLHEREPHGSQDLRRTPGRRRRSRSVAGSDHRPGQGHRLERHGRPERHRHRRQDALQATPAGTAPESPATPRTRSGPPPGT